MNDQLSYEQLIEAATTLLRENERLTKSEQTVRADRDTLRERNASLETRVAQLQSELFNARERAKRLAKKLGRVSETQFTSG